jgi:hypothetical protein
MKYSVEGTLQFAEYFDAHKKAAQIRRAVLRTIGLLGGLFFILYQPGSMAEPVWSNWPSTFGTILILYVLVISPIQFRYRVKRNWSRYPALHKKQRLSFDHTGVTSVDDVGNPALTKWNKFIKWRETKLTFMLFLSPHLWTVVPKRLLGIGKVAEFSTFITSVINAKQPG